MVLEILQRTKKVIIDNGWCQNAFTNDKGEICLSQAFRIAARPANPYDFHDAYNVINALLPTAYPTVIAYNDAAGRTKEEVLALLDEAIESAS